MSCVLSDATFLLVFTCLHLTARCTCASASVCAPASVRVDDCAGGEGQAVCAVRFGALQDRPRTRAIASSPRYTDASASFSPSPFSLVNFFYLFFYISVVCCLLFYFVFRALLPSLILLDGFTFMSFRFFPVNSALSLRLFRAGATGVRRWPPFTSLRHPSLRLVPTW